MAVILAYPRWYSDHFISWATLWYANFHAQGKFVRLLSILELFRKDIVLTLSHFTRLMTYMTFFIMAMAHSLFQGPVTQRRFLLNTLKTLFKLSWSSLIYKSLEMHPKWRYKICICSVILGKIESYRNYKSLSIIFRKF